jgi:hypothetical protein
MNASRITAMAVAIFLIGRAAPALAQSAEDKAAAERLFNDAMTLMDRKDYDGACPKFAESLRLDAGIGVMLHLADCYEHLGRAASAWGMFREAAELATRQGDDRRAEVARRHAAALEPSLSTLTITIVAPDPALTVTRDGVEVGRAQWGLAIPVDPGPHVVAATAPGSRSWQTTTHVPGAHASVTLAVPALEPEAPSRGEPAPTPVPAVAAAASVASVGAVAPSAPSASPAPPPGSAPASSLGTMRISAIAAGGAGLVGLGLGAYFGLRAGSDLADSNANGNCVGDHCNDAGTRARNDALGAATASTVAFVVGAAAVGAGVVLWLVAPRAHAPAVGLTGATTGRDGAVVLHGAFE